MEKGEKQLATALKSSRSTDITYKTMQRKILIVDDHLFNIDAIMIILQCRVHLDVDFVCDKATNGQEAIDIIRHDVTHLN